MDTSYGSIQALQGHNTLQHLNKYVTTRVAHKKAIFVK